MPRVQLQVELPEGMPLASLSELLAMNGIALRGFSRNGGGEPAWQPDPASLSVTEAERAVLRAFTYCDTNEEIAAALHIGAETVRTHAKSLYRKLKVKSRAFAVGRALRLGLLSLQDLVPPPGG